MTAATENKTSSSPQGKNDASSEDPDPSQKSINASAYGHGGSRIFNPPRYVKRNLPFSQSRNLVDIEHNKGLQIGKLVRHDLFHVLLRRKLYVSLTLFLVAWSVAVVAFAGLYLVNDRNKTSDVCSLFAASGTSSYHGAFAFSLQTCTTVGYTLPLGSDAFFQNCPALQTLMYLQSVWSMLFNAMLIAFIYSRVARAEQRSVQLIFSDKAIISITQEEPHHPPQVRFQVRVYDVDATHPVVEARCRIYTVLKERPVPRPLRLIQPNDELGAPLFLSIPTVIVHHVDHYSALHPSNSDTELPVSPSGLNLRQADSYISNREEVVCPICGESYGTHQRWVNHVQTQLRIEVKFNYPVEGAHRSIPESQLQAPLPPDARTLEELREYFQKEVAEVIVIAGGQDPLTSGSFQAMQSYCFDDIVWDANAVFRPCIFPTDSTKGNVNKNKTEAALFIDLESFHQIDISLPSSSSAAAAAAPATSNESNNTDTGTGEAATTDAATKRHRERYLSTRPADGFLFPSSS